VKRLINGDGTVPPIPIVWGISATVDRFRAAMAGGAIAVLLVVLGVAVWLLGSDDEAARAEARRRVVSALELRGVRLEPVRPDQLPSDRPGDSQVIKVTLADEHLSGGAVDRALLAQLEELGPRVV